MSRRITVYTIRTWLLGIAILSIWLIPSPGIMGVRTSLGLIVAILVAGRFSHHVQSRILLFLAAGLIVVIPAEFSIWRKVLAQIIAVTSLILPGTLVQGLVWGTMSLAIIIAPKWGWLIVLAAAVIAAKKNDVKPPRWILLFGITCSLAASLISIVLLNYPMIPFHGQEYAVRWRIAGALNRRNPKVRLKSIFDALQNTRDQGDMDYLGILDDVEGKLGSSPDITALRIAALNAAGMTEEARAYFVESVRMVPSISNRISEWFPTCAPWINAASYLNTGNPDLRTVFRAFQIESLEDSISVEYAARTLLSCGLSDEACSLSLAAGYGDHGWGRYILWRSRMPWDIHPQTRMIVDTTFSAPGKSFILLHGEPARGKWPEYRMRCRGQEYTTSVRAEFPVAVPLYGSSCSLRFVNDLRSYRDDRNLVYSGMISADADYPHISDADLSSLWARIMRRVETWNLSVTDSFDILDIGISETMDCIDFTDTAGVSPDTVGFMMTSNGYLQWAHIPSGEYTAIMRAEPAQGRWPVVEWWEGSTVRHIAIDSWSWKHFPISHQSIDSVLIFRFSDDYWNEETHEDRNVWFACLFRS